MEPRGTQSFFGGHLLVPTVCKAEPWDIKRSNKPDLKGRKHCPCLVCGRKSKEVRERASWRKVNPAWMTVCSWNPRLKIQNLPQRAVSEQAS